MSNALLGFGVVAATIFVIYKNRHRPYVWNELSAPVRFATLPFYAFSAFYIIFLMEEFVRCIPTDIMLIISWTLGFFNFFFNVDVTAAFIVWQIVGDLMATVPLAIGIFYASIFPSIKENARHTFIYRACALAIISVLSFITVVPAPSMSWYDKLIFLSAAVIAATVSYISIDMDFHDQDDSDNIFDSLKSATKQIKKILHLKKSK